MLNQRFSHWSKFLEKTNEKDHVFHPIVFVSYSHPQRLEETSGSIFCPSLRHSIYVHTSSSLWRRKWFHVNVGSCPRITNNPWHEYHSTSCATKTSCHTFNLGGLKKSAASPCENSIWESHWNWSTSNKFQEYIKWLVSAYARECFLFVQTLEFE